VSTRLPNRCEKEFVAQFFWILLDIPSWGDVGRLVADLLDFLGSPVIEWVFGASTIKMNTKVLILRVVCLLNVVFAISAAGADATLRPGDQIEMKLGGVPSAETSALSGIYSLDGEGSVNLPHIGRVKIAGLTSGAAESAIENAYKSRAIYTNTNVAITMQAQSRFVNVGGEVKTPQRVPYTTDLTILSSINAAGGFSPLANERKVRLLRGNQVMVVDVNKIRANPSLDPQVQPGDRIEVLSIFESSKNSPEKLQPARQNADVASSEPAALETELKQAQDKLQRAQQNADLASNQRTALETQLKEAPDKLQQAQQNADLASSQRAALETQLKQAQDKLQQAQQNADLASNQRAALETQLKQAQDKLQQAQQNADSASNQRAALEVRLKRAEENLQRPDPAATLRNAAVVKKNEEDSANQPRSGRALPLDAGENPRPGTLTQPLIQRVQSVNH
jgi:protein involved in polysaccharide export with SLBB domain